MRTQHAVSLLRAVKLFVSPWRKHCRQKQIKDILDSKHSNKGGTPEQQALREKLQGFRSEFETVLVRWGRAAWSQPWGAGGSVRAVFPQECVAFWTGGLVLAHTHTAHTAAAHTT